MTEVHAKGRQVTEADLDLFRNECRCGTYPRIREAILQGAQSMGKPHRHHTKRRRRKHRRRRGAPGG